MKKSVLIKLVEEVVNKKLNEAEDIDPEIINLFNKYNEALKNSMVYISFWGKQNSIKSWKQGTFEIKIDINDPYIDNSKYENGSAFTYFNDDLYTLLNKISMENGFDEISTNNTGSIFWTSKK